MYVGASTGYMLRNHECSYSVLSQVSHHFLPVLLRQYYSTPCNVRVHLTGWMRGATVRVLQVGVYFLQGSTVQLHLQCASARKNTEEGETCRLNIGRERSLDM